MPQMNASQLRAIAAALDGLARISEASDHTVSVTDAYGQITLDVDGDMIAVSDTDGAGPYLVDVASTPR